MKKLFICLFLLACSPELKRIPVLPQTTDVELLLRFDGSLLLTKSKEETRLAWATMLIRGTHRKSYIPFVDSLYDKYYHRVIRLSKTKFDTVSANGMNFRGHQTSQDSILRVLDFRKIDLRGNLTQAWIDILGTVIGDSLRNDEVENVLESERWPWGTKEKKFYIPIRFENVTLSFIDSLKSEVKSITMMNGVPDTIWQIGQYSIDTTLFRDSLIVEGRPLKDLTFQQIQDGISVSTKSKTYMQNKVIGKNGITNSSKVWDIFRNPNRASGFLFMRDSIFTAGIKKRWLKSKSK